MDEEQPCGSSWMKVHNQSVKELWMKAELSWQKSRKGLHWMRVWENIKAVEKGKLAAAKQQVEEFIAGGILNKITLLESILEFPTSKILNLFGEIINQLKLSVCHKLKFWGQKLEKIFCFIMRWQFWSLVTWKLKRHSYQTARPNLYCLFARAIG